MKTFFIFEPAKIDPTPRFFKTANGTLRHICILPPVSTLSPSGQPMSQELGTLEIMSYPTAVDGILAHVMQQVDPLFGKSYTEVVPSDRERAGAEVESGITRTEYPEVKKGQMDVAAIHLKGHGATDAEMRDSRGKLNYTKVKATAKRLDVSFPNLF